MTDIHITRSIFDKFNHNGKIKLSSSYIQEVFEADGYPNHEGVVQILKGRCDVGLMGPFNFCFRLKISDGIFQYNTLVSIDCQSKVDKDKEHLGEGAIIAITDVEICHGETAKPIFIIKDYIMLSRYHSILQIPDMKIRPHSGNKDEHKGYRSTAIIEDNWAEAEEFSSEQQENVSNPPAAKISRTNDSNVASRSRNPPPPQNRKSANKSECGIMPIAAVTPYASNIKIHGMVSRKNEIKAIPAKNMKILNFELTDTHGDCIQITAFNELAESLDSLIVENMSYYITGGSIRAANKRFNSTGHDYEITLRSDSKVEPGGEIFSTPKLNMKRIDLNNISAAIGNIIDVLVVVERLDEEPVTFTSRQGKELVKREMDLIDESAVQVRLTLWGEEAKNVSNDLVGKVVLFKGVIAKEFNGSYSLSGTSSTRIYNVPELPGVAELFEWYETVRPNADVKNMSQMLTSGGDAIRTISGITEMRFGDGSDRGDYATVEAMITRINTDKSVYRGCPNEGCQKKVVEMNGEFRCEKCMLTTQNFKWLYMMQFEISDFTGQVYVTAFGDTAAKIVGRSAEDIGELKDHDPVAYKNIFQGIQFKPKMWRLRCKMETYNEEMRQRINVFSVEDVNCDKFVSNLEEMVKMLEQI